MFFSIFFPVFAVFLLIVIVKTAFTRPYESKYRPTPERPPQTVEFKIVKVPQSASIPHLVGKKLKMYEDSSFDGTFPVVLKTLDGRVVGLVDSHYAMSFSWSLHQLLSCEIVRADDNGIFARAVFEGCAFIKYDPKACE